MGQGDVYNILEKEDRWMTARDIYNLKRVATVNNIRVALMKLYKARYILRVQRRTKSGGVIYYYRVNE